MRTLLADCRLQIADWHRCLSFFPATLLWLLNVAQRDQTCKRKQADGQKHLREAQQ
jgi:hypothetical protein